MNSNDTGESARQSVGTFFDELIDGYAKTIERCFPRYREMLRALLDYLPRDREVQTILELGCGTGNLSLLLQQKYPEASIWFVDVSGDSLEVCQSRIGTSKQYAFDQHDFRDMQFDAGMFDLVTSSIAIHHLIPEEKQSLFEDINVWLKPDGIFSFADQMAGATDDLYSRHMLNWQTASLGAGSTEEEWTMWMQHQLEHDHHDNLIDHIGWLQAAGFSIVDVTWRYLLWTVMQCRKNAAR